MDHTISAEHRRLSQLGPIAEHLTEGLVVSNHLGELVFWNRAALELHGLTRREEGLRPMPDFAASFELSCLDGAVLPVERWPLARILRGEQLRDVELQVRHLQQGWSRIFSYGGGLSVVVDEPNPLGVLRILDVTERRQAEQALRAAGERERALLDKSCDMLLLVDADGVIRYWSPGATSLLGWSSEQVHGRAALELVHPEDLAEAKRLMGELLASDGKTARTVTRLRHQTGSWRLVESIGRNLLGDPLVRGIVVNSRDISEQRRLQEQLLEAQKLETVGRLAGGVAHDFNNLLTAILGGAEALRDDLDGGRQLQREDLDAISEAGARAQQLTRQLLGFARRQFITPTSIDLAGFVRETMGLLRPLLPDVVALATSLAEDSWHVRCDRAQLQQILVALVVNARDAMPAGGTVTIETGNVTLDEAALSAQAGVSASRHGRLTVRDTGVGLSPQAKAHLFEPFYSTKGQGKGTGLGLATVYGIVKQNAGFVVVESEPGQGAAFHVHLPRTEETVAVSAPPAPAELRGTETVLVAEDEPLVCGLAHRALLRAGYRTFVASNGRDALKVVESLNGAIDLLVTDVMMPDMNGRELALTLLRQYPLLRVLYISGYTEDAIVDHGVLEPSVEFLAKPFTHGVLLARIRAILDQTPVTPRPR